MKSEHRGNLLTAILIFNLMQMGEVLKGDTRGVCLLGKFLLSLELKTSKYFLQKRLHKKQANMDEFQKELNGNNKNTQLLKSDLASFEHKQNEGTNDIFKQIMEDISNLEKDFQKCYQLDVNENLFLK